MAVSECKETLDMMPFIIFIMSVSVAIASYLLTQFFVGPVLRIMNLRREMHETFLVYGNLWDIAPSDKEYSISRLHNAREEYRKLAARGLAEDENLRISRVYWLAKKYLDKRSINLKEAAKQFWAMEADAANPDDKFRKDVEAKIRDSLKLKTG